MKYYAISGLTAAYDISRESIKNWIKSGKLEAQKIPQSEHTYMYIIPESELWKLESRKKKEPIPYEKDKPVYEQKKRNVEYRTYMQSEAWQKVRRARLHIDDYKCQRCGRGKNLQVHHISYEHLGQAGEIEDLVTLCRECHEEIHKGDIRQGGQRNE